MGRDAGGQLLVGDPEIGDPDQPVPAKKHVLRLHITVDDTGPVNLLQATQDLPGDVDGLRDWNAAPANNRLLEVLRRRCTAAR